MNTDPGFTTIELIILMVITSIIAASAMSLMLSPSLMQASGFANVLRQDLQLTAALSISGNQRYRLVLGANSYQILDQSGVAITLPETKTTTMSFPGGVTISPTLTIAFDGEGKPYLYNAGTYTAIASSTQVLSVASNPYTQSVNLTPQTGYVE